MEKEISKKYKSLMKRSFKVDLRMFLFQNFIAGLEHTNIQSTTYKLFSPDESLMKRYVRIHQLSKSSDVIEGTNLQVGQFDVFLKSWQVNNTLLAKEFKIVFVDKFISQGEFENFLSKHT